MAIGRLKSNLLAAAYDSWIDFAARKTSRKAALTTARSFHMQQMAGSAFAVWHRNAADDADERRVTSSSGILRVIEVVVKTNSCMQLACCLTPMTEHA